MGHREARALALSMLRIRHLAPILTSVLLFTSTDALAQYRPFCSSVPKACTYAGPDAPVLRADVCWNGSVALLKGSSSCPTGTWPYYVDHGEVISATGTVLAYVPLDWACDHPGICIASPIPDGATEEPICCEGGSCVPLANGCQGQILMCENGVTNDDGTVTCFEGANVP